MKEEGAVSVVSKQDSRLLRVKSQVSLRHEDRKIWLKMGKEILRQYIFFFYSFFLILLKNYLQMCQYVNMYI